MLFFIIPAVYIAQFDPQATVESIQEGCKFLFPEDINIIMLLGARTDVWVSPYSYKTALFPLVIVICVTVGLQIKDERAHYLADAKADVRNAMPCHCKMTWQKV